MLLEPSFIHRLDLLTLATKAATSGSGAGGRRSPAVGASVEFRDFRTYSPGDDYRRVDWNTYARLERLFLRLYQAEEQTCVTFLLDCSASMEQGGTADSAEGSKFRAAQRLAAALSYIVLHGDDMVAVGAVGQRLAAYLPPRGGRQVAGEVWGFVERLQPSSRGPAGSDLAAALRDAAAHLRRGGLTFVLSDLLTTSDWRRGLLALRAAKQQVTLLQILSPDELNPSLRGDLALVDRETGARREVTVTAAAVRAYQERLAAYTQEIAAYCHGHDIAFLQLSSALSLADVVLRVLRKNGVVRA